MILTTLTTQITLITITTQITLVTLITIKSPQNPYYYSCNYNLDNPITVITLATLKILMALSRPIALITITTFIT